MYYGGRAMPNKEESVLEDFIGTVCTEVFVRVLHVLLNFL